MSKSLHLSMLLVYIRSRIKIKLMLQKEIYQNSYNSKSGLIGYDIRDLTTLAEQRDKLQTLINEMTENPFKPLHSMIWEYIKFLEVV